jgi:glycosyltransferase involved in cell wall biosynthesis
MKLKESLVSIILPVYNADNFLIHCLETLMKQSYANLEIIAIDDKSKDNSLKILKEFKKKYKKTHPEQNRKVHILQNKKHYGSAVCLNRAIRIAQGQFLTFMNPFDYVSLHRLKRQINYLSINPKTVAIGSQYVTINENKKPIEKSNLPQQHEEIYHTLLHSISLKPETVMINRMLLPKDILHFTTNKYPLLFTEVLIKLLQYGKIANLNQSLYTHRLIIKRYARQSSKLKHTLSLLQLWLKSRSIYNYRPSLRTSIPAMFRNS